MSTNGNADGQSTLAAAHGALEHKAPHNYHPENIAGKAILVTGGTTGIGLATAQMLLERGARVLIYGRDENALREALEKLQPLGEVHGLTADQSSREDIERIFSEVESRLGGLDILVNNAAVSAGSVTENDLDEIQYGINANLFGYIACAREAVQRLKGRGGHIVNIGSLSADAREEGNDVYVATKAAIQAFTEALRKTVNSEGIKVSLVEPGLVATDMTTSSPEDTQQKFEEEKILEPMDIAEAVHYCLTQPQRCDVIAVQIRPHGQSI